MNTFVGFCGYSLAGKSEAAKYLERAYGYKRMSFGAHATEETLNMLKEYAVRVLKKKPDSDSIKQLLARYRQEMNDPEMKEKWRKTIVEVGFIQRMMDPLYFCRKINDEMIEDIHDNPPITKFTIDNIRFQEEADFFYKTHTSFIIRINNNRLDLSDPKYEESTENPDGIKHDYVINNDSSLGKLYAGIDHAMSEFATVVSDAVYNEIKGCKNVN